MVSNKLDIELWLDKLEKREPTPNMMIWMKEYDQICNRNCCYSADCGVIKCSGCGICLTIIPPITRIQCTECEILPIDAIYDPRPEYCERCFNNPLVLHHHNLFLEVDSKGLHSLKIRHTGFCELLMINTQDFKVITKKIVNNYCNICGDLFDISNPAVSHPGCKKEHGSPIKDKIKGVLDSFSFSHADCLMKWYEYSKRDKYCGIKSFCEVCNFELEMESWSNFFLEAKERINDNLKLNKEIYSIIIEIEKQLTINFSNDEKNLLKDCITDDNFIRKLYDFIIVKLKSLHPQEWIRSIIFKIF